MFLYSVIFIFGSIIGSFLNCLSWRLKNRKKFVLTRSQCPKCGIELKWWENVPILSFLGLRGKCRYCEVKIPLNYFLTELFSGLLFVWVFWFNSGSNIIGLDLIKIFLEFFIVSILLFVFLHDILYKEILPGAIWLGLGVVLVYQFFLQTDIGGIFWGAVLGFGFFAFQYFISKGRWIGGGDVRFGFLMGALLGVKKIIVALLFAYWFGALVGVLLIIFKKRKMGSEIPFGTFLAVGTILAMYYGEYIIRWYMNIIS